MVPYSCRWVRLCWETSRTHFKTFKRIRQLIFTLSLFTVAKCYELWFTDFVSEVCVTRIRLSLWYISFKLQRYFVVFHWKLYTRSIAASDPHAYALSKEVIARSSPVNSSHAAFSVSRLWVFNFSQPLFVRGFIISRRKETEIKLLVQRKHTTVARERRSYDSLWKRLEIQTEQCAVRFGTYRTVSLEIENRMPNFWKFWRQPRRPTFKAEPFGRKRLMQITANCGGLLMLTRKILRTKVSVDIRLVR